MFMKYVYYQYCMINLLYTLHVHYYEYPITVFTTVGCIKSPSELRSEINIFNSKFQGDYEL